jgi:hypothetical protein
LEVVSVAHCSKPSRPVEAMTPRAQRSRGTGAVSRSRFGRRGWVLGGRLADSAISSSWASSWSRVGPTLSVAFPCDQDGASRLPSHVGGVQIRWSVPSQQWLRRTALRLSAGPTLQSPQGRFSEGPAATSSAVGAGWHQAQHSREVPRAGTAVSGRRPPARACRRRTDGSVVFRCS